MEIEILKEKETPLLSRRRITAMATYEGATPSRIKFLQAVSKELKADTKLISIRHIYTRFGSTRAKLIIHQYMDRESFEKLESKNTAKKHEIKEEKKENNDASGQKPEQKPAEEAAVADSKAEPAAEDKGKDAEEKTAPEKEAKDAAKE
ncbi:hypothetical protein JXB31_03635 [Candidatus Woesearchaeota archaeon]|nr:hypothetical protein [Candidatus Woesearchaeota archaeon]